MEHERDTFFGDKISPECRVARYLGILVMWAGSTRLRITNHTSYEVRMIDPKPSTSHRSILLELTYI